MLREIGGQFLRLLLTEQSRRLYRLILSNVDAHPAVAQRFYEAGPRTFIQRLAGYLKSKSDDGEVAFDDPELSAAQFFSLIRGELHMRATCPARRLQKTLATVATSVAEGSGCAAR